MCCGICSDYPYCEIKGKLKEDCCFKCPDYKGCISETREEFDGNYDTEEEFDEDFGEDEEY